jgi:hypothetical protein
MRGLKEIFQRKDRLAQAYRAVFESPEGEVVLAHLCKVGHVFSPTAVAGDPHMTYMQEGERRMVLSIMKILKTDFSKLQQLMEDQDV